MNENSKLLYEQIVEYLKNKIINKEFKADEKLPTELDLADMFGVSRITSKRALEELKQEGLIYRVRGSGSFVAPIEDFTKSEVDISNRDMNPDKVIAMVIPLGKTDNSIVKASVDGMMDIIRGVSEVLNERGFYLSIYSEHRDILKEKTILNKLYKNKTRGIIYYPISDRENLEFLNILYLEEYPLITIDKYFENIPISYVTTDNAGGGYKAAKHLIGLGHKQIAFVSDVTIERASSVRERYFGYCKALKESGIPINHELVRVGFYINECSPLIQQKSVYEEIIQNLVQKKVSSIVAVNDMVASFLMRAALELNIKVPDDLSITGFDNIEISKHLQVPLTTISQDFYKMGQSAARLLISNIESGRYTYNKIVLPAELIIRNSCSEKE